MKIYSTFKSAGLAIILAACMGGASNATLLQANTVACSGDVFQTCSKSNFLNAVGGGPLDLSLDLASDKNGNVVPDGFVAGDLFSDHLTFSSGASTVFGGSDNADVQYFAPNPLLSQVGPIDFDGILAIDFTNPVSAVGFTTVSLETNGTIEVFDSTDTLIGSLSGLSNLVLDYVGLIATDGIEISRLTIEGDFFAVRDIQFNFANPQSGGSSVPEPAPVALLGFGILGFAAMRRWRGA